MCQLFETIKYCDGIFYDLSFHNERMNNARKILFDRNDKIKLENILSMQIIEGNKAVKVNVYYSKEIEEVKYSVYESKKIERLKMIICDEIEYEFKYSDRRIFDELKEKAFCEENEEILIIKNNFITDTSFTNVAFYDGKKWFTPSTPILKGTKRAQLLKDGIMTEFELKKEDLNKFISVKLFNAMLDFDNCPTLPTTSIY